MDDKEAQLIQPIVNHLKAAITNALTVMPGMFVFGAITRSGLDKWSDNRLSSVSVILFGLLPALWVWWMYYKTNGLMHRSGFGRRKQAVD